MKIRGRHKDAYGGTGGRQAVVERDGFSIIRITGGRMARDWFATSLRVESGAGFHSAIFPRELAARFVRTYSDCGALVVDPFSGSGTTGVAAKELGRRYVGVELNGRYCDASQSRIDNASVRDADLRTRKAAPAAVTTQGRLF
jgi:DNA modification methylase